MPLRWLLVHGDSGALLGHVRRTTLRYSHSTVVFRSNRIVTCHGLKNIRNISYVNVSQATKSSADQAGAADAIKSCHFERCLMANQLCRDAIRIVLFV